MRTEVKTKTLMLAATAAGITLDDLRSKCRSRDIVDRRKVVCKILKDSGYSTTAIGLALNRDHASVVYLTKSCLELMAFDNDFRSRYHESKSKFESMMSIAEEDREMLIRYISVVVANEIDNIIANPSHIIRVIKRVRNMVSDYKADEYNI